MSHRLVRVLTVLTAIAMTAPAAFAQPAPIPLDPDADRLAQLNALVRVPSGVVDITDGLFEALSEMDEVPGQVYDYFLTDASRGWRTLHEWAKAPAQQRAIEKAYELTEGEGPFLLGVRYGETAWAEQGLGVLIADGAPLVEMDFAYLDAVEDLTLAMSVEMWDRAEAGNAEGVSETALAWVRLARIILDRETVIEKTRGYGLLMDGLARLRDVVYTHPGLYDVASYTALIESLDNDELELDRVRLPRGARLVAMDLMEKTMVPEGGVDPTKFGLVMAESLTPEDRPLELFSLTAEMNAAGAIHAGWYETYDELNKVLGDWFVRWETPDFHSTTLLGPSDFERLPPMSYEIVTGTLGAIHDLFELRLDALTELFGTRTSMAVLSFKSRNNRFPPNIASVAPQFVPELDVDPWSVHPRFLRGTEENLTRTRFEKSIPFQYLVPIRDQRWGPREEKVPYEILFAMTERFDDFGGASAGMGGDDPFGAMGMGGLGGFTVDPAEAARLEAAFEEVLLAIEEHVDVDTGEYNREALEEVLLGLMREEFAVDQEEIDSMQQQVSAVVMGTSNNQQAISNIEMMIDQFAGFIPDDPQIAQEIGVSVSEIVSVVRLYLGKVLRSDSFDSMMTTVRGGGQVTAEQVRVASEETVRLALDPEVFRAGLEIYRKLDPAIFEGMAEGFDEGLAGVASEPAEFTARFDDTVFLLWSVWDDQRNDAARVVGPGGTDYLIWPPLPSVERDGGTAN